MADTPLPKPDQRPKLQLERHGLVAKKSFGQNFLSDASIAQRIAELAGAGGATVVEIGAGLGALTAPLLCVATRVLAIERDRDLIPALRERFASELERGQLEILEADAKTADWLGLLQSAPPPRVIAGNLPYQLTGPLLERTTRLSEEIDRAVFLVQLEVAERLMARPGTEHYGGLSVFIQAAFEVTRPLIVRRGAFFPQPRVDSAVIQLNPRRPRLAQEDAVFRALVRGAFAQRRKKLRNAWRGVLGVPVSELEALAKQVGIELDARGESLGVSEFEQLARLLRSVLESNR